MLKSIGAYDEESVHFIANKAQIIADILQVENGQLHIEGRNRIELFENNYSVFVQDETGNRYELDYYRAPYFDTNDENGNTLFKAEAFRVNLPFNSSHTFYFIIESKEKTYQRKMNIVYGKFSRLSKLDGAYFVEQNMIAIANSNSIEIKPAKLSSCLLLESNFRKTLQNNCPKEILQLRKKAKALSKGKPIILIFDRNDRAGDNAEALFKYISKMKNQSKYRIFFAVSRESEDFIRLKKYGDVLDFGSSEYLSTFLAADMVISSQWANWAINPFGTEREYVKDIIKFKFVFLQHGITFGNMSDWGNRIRRNISYFITATKYEYTSIVNGHYGYEPSQVLLTGMPRYDYMSDEKEKLIVLAPTWRKYMNFETIPGSYRLKVTEDIKETEYFSFFNSLINNSRILKAMKEKGYKGVFCIHPLFMEMRNMFEGNELFSIAEDGFSYNEIIKRGAFMITDYSSVVSDFAYLKKPVLYAQFDYTKFFASHTYSEGAFSYELDGFGPVTYTYEETVDKIVETITNDCAEPEEYAKRVEEFFSYNDKNNCKRICDRLGLE